MIRIDLPPDATAAERWALETLVDLSRLLPCEPGVSGAVVVGPGTGEGITIEDRRVVVGRATLARVVAVAGAGTEQGSDRADAHGRVPAEANPLVLEQRERSPVIQQLARDLRENAARAAGRGAVRCLAPWPEGRRWAMAMTHDLDVVSGWPLFTLARLAELFRRGRLHEMGQVVSAAMGAVGEFPVLAALTEVLEIERRFGVPSTWFVLTGDPTLARWRRGDVTYRLEGAAARRCLLAIQHEGHEVGLHGSMETWIDPAAFAAERRRLEGVTGAPVRGVRQHFLKMRPGATQRAMVSAGLGYDASYGFSGRNGFRLGVADLVQGWDAAEGKGGGLEEVPLHWMDRALSKYQGIEDPRELVADGLALAEAARVEEGVWVGLWHPNLAPALGYPGAPEAFTWMLEELAGQGAWMARLGEVVDWRVARRRARARAVSADGRVELAPAPAARWPVALEDADGRGA